jgi:hypothetical protein
MIKLIVAFRFFEKAPEKLRMNALYVVLIYICVYVETTIQMLKEIQLRGYELDLTG